MGERRCSAATALIAAVTSMAMLVGCTSGRTKSDPTVTKTAATSTVSTGSMTTSTGATTTKPTATTTTPARTTPSLTRPTVPADVPRTGKNLLNKNEKPPVMPLVATTHTAAGAKAFAEFFMRTIDWGFATTNGAYMHHYYDASCQACRAYYENLETGRKKGYFHIGDRITPKFSRDVTASHSAVAGSSRIVDVTFDLSADEVLDRHNKFVSGDSAGRNLVLRCYLRWSGGSWRIVAADPVRT